MKHERGFAMADALVALMLLSVLLTSLIGVNTNSLEASQKANARLTATLIAQAVLEDRSVRDDEGSFTVNGTAYDWTREAVTLPASIDDTALLDEITITVEWQVKSGKNHVTLATSRWRANNG